MKKKAAPPVVRRDGTGHLNPVYAASLRERTKENVPPVEEAFQLRGDPLAQELGESVLRIATSGEDSESEALDEAVPEESGGPFIETSSNVEVAHGTDASNPKRATREPFPTV